VKVLCAESSLIWSDLTGEKPVMPLEKLNFELQSGDSFVVVMDLAFSVLQWVLKVPQAKLRLTVNDDSACLNVEDLPLLRGTVAVLNMLGLPKLFQTTTESFRLFISNVANSSDHEDVTFRMEMSLRLPMSSVAAALIRQSSSIFHKSFFGMYQLLEEVFKSIANDLQAQINRPSISVEVRRRAFRSEDTKNTDVEVQFEGFLVKDPENNSDNFDESIPSFGSADLLSKESVRNRRSKTLRGILFKYSNASRKWNRRAVFLEGDVMYIFVKNFDQKPGRILQLKNYSLESNSGEEKISSKYYFVLKNTFSKEEVIFGDDDLDLISLWVEKMKNFLVCSSAAIF
jgi:hypothetical protein